MSTGSLTILGTGIKAVGQTTLEALSHIQRAEKLLFLVADPVTARWLLEQNPTAESLFALYLEDRPRRETYSQIVERILTQVRSGQRVCVATYGHPGVFSYPTHEAIRRARAEGYSATMLPGVSAEDCLFADLGVDPGEYGCQSYEATNFLISEPKVDPRASLILWQVGLVGHSSHRSRYSLAGLPLLVESLETMYGPSHEVTVYEAARYPVCDPIVERVELQRLTTVRVVTASTLYVPPLAKAEPNREVVSRLSAAIAQGD